MKNSPAELIKFQFIEKKHEKSNGALTRDFEASCLNQAKRVANRLQTFKGTYIQLVDEYGNVLVSRGSRGKWVSHVAYERI